MSIIDSFIKTLDSFSEQPKSFQYLVDQPCNLLPSPASDAVVPTCCERAVRYASLAFRFWHSGLRDSFFLLELTSHQNISDICQIENGPQHTELRAKHSLTAINVEDAIITERELQDAETFASFCFPTASSTLAAAVIQYKQEAVVYLKFPFQSLLLHAVFVPHPRPDHPSGPSLFTSWKPIDILQIFASPISDIDQVSTCRIQRLLNRVASLSGETLNATAKTTNCVSAEQVDLDIDQGAQRKPNSSRTSCTLIETDSHLVHGEDMPYPLGPDLPTATSGFIFEKPLDSMAPTITVPMGKCDPYKANSPTISLDNERADPMDGKRFITDSQNQFADDFLSDPFRNLNSSLFREEWYHKPLISKRSHWSIQTNVASSPAWSNQSSSPADNGDIPPWTLRPPSPPFLQCYSSSSRSLANFSITEETGPFSVDGGCRRSSYTGPTTPYWLRSPLSKSQRDGSSEGSFTEDQDLQRLPATCHSTSTVSRDKQKQKRDELLYCSDRFDTALTPRILMGRSSSEEFSPPTSAENFSHIRPGSAPESDRYSRAGPSRLGDFHSQWGRFPRLEREGLPSQTFSTDQSNGLTHRVMSEDWESALQKQLQKEEEIAASVAHQISSETAWLVALQQYQKLARPSSSSRSTSLEPDRHLALQIQLEEANVASRLNAPRSPHESTPDASGSESHFECGICHDRWSSDVKISVVDCEHSYCRECVGLLAKAKIEDNRYPIVCPDCLIDRSRGIKCQISLDILQGLDLSPRELERLEELQTLSHSVVLECPKCDERLSINRPEYGARKFFICSVKECGYKWCRDCLKAVKSLEDRHRCKNENIERLMKKQGWKYCPGCRTPVQKEYGCNHMTCSAPGCNAHFCYKCGALIVDTTHGGDVGLTVTEHYANSKCRLFDRRFYCTIQ